MKTCQRIRAAFVAAVVACCLLLLPPSARAGDYYMPRVSIQGTVMQNGDLQVTETRAFEFDEDINGVFWNVPLAENQQGAVSELAIDDVRITSVDGEASNVPFQRVDYASAGDREVYTVSDEGGAIELKVFSPQDSGDEVEFTVRYTLRGAVMAWADAAELYWKFIGPDWSEASEDVRLDISFAACAGGAGPSLAKGDVRAWGHGPLDASVSLDVSSAGATARYDVPAVEPGEFAEARMAFPTTLVPEMSPQGGERLQTILDEEQAWADEANERREKARVQGAVVTAALLGVSALLLGIALWARFVKYASPKPVFDEDYFRDVPSQDHPAVLSAFMADGSVEPRAFVATLMKLTDDGVVALDSETREEKRLFGTKRVEEYTLRLVDIARATDPIDRAAIALYFGSGARNGDELSFDGAMAIDEYDEEGTSALDEFVAEVEAQLELRNLTCMVPAAYEIAMVALAFMVGILSFVLVLGMELASVAVFLATTAMLVATVILVGTTKFLAPEAVELRERCEALERWLEDFTNLGEAVPGDLVLWNKLLVMAVAFGVSDEVLRQLADAVPVDLRGSEEMGYRYPVYWWCYPHGRLNAPAGSLQTAYRESASQLAASSDSSGGGFGGGFSGGGGGGVGGGGGGTF